MNLIFTKAYNHCIDQDGFRQGIYANDSKPTLDNTIVMFKSLPDSQGMVYDAKFM